MRRTHHQPGSREDIFRTHTKWMRRGVFILMLYVLITQWDSFSIPFSTNTPQDTKNPPSIRDNSTTLTDTSTPTPTEVTTLPFIPSLTDSKKGEGSIIARCGDTVTFSYTLHDKSGQHLITNEKRTSTIGSHLEAALLSQILDGVRSGTVRQIIIDNHYLKQIHPEFTLSEEGRYAILATISNVIRNDSIEPESSCVLSSKWEKPIPFR